MVNMRLISKSQIVSPPEENQQPHPHPHPNLKIELTPWDLQLLLVDSIQKGLLFHKPKSTNPSFIINHLKTSLSRTLHYFPPLSGRLATTQHYNNSISYFIDCNNFGAEFLHAIADGVSITDVMDCTYVPDEIVCWFFPLNGVKNHQGSSKPLLAVQVTELTDGIFIGCSMNHCVGDGTSFWHFINCWSEISRGFDNSDTLSKPPIFQRSSFHLPLHVPPLLTSQQMYNACAYTPPPFKQRVFNFSKQNIAKLKSKANSEIGEINKISSLQAVLSHLWRSVIRHKNIDPNQEVNYRLQIGVRPRLKNPPMPKHYFGNAIQTGSVRMKAGEVEERGLGHVALEMNNMVRMHTEDKLLENLDTWKKNPTLMTMDNMITDSLITSSSPWFDVYGNDFGWGKPIAVRSGPSNKSDGKITVFEGVEQGSVDVEASLSVETLQGMEMDAEFMDFVTVTRGIGVK